MSDGGRFGKRIGPPRSFVGTSSLQSPRSCRAERTAMKSRISVESRRLNAVLRLEVLERRDAPAALTPAQVRHAYGFDQIQFATAAGAVAGDGRGTTIAIVDAYNDPFVSSDLDTFDRRYGING